MSPLERLWAGWRTDYVSSAAGGLAHAHLDECVFCRIHASGEPDTATYVLWRSETCVALLNAYPYGSGHLMVMPQRHVGEIEELTDIEGRELWLGLTAAVRAIKAAYSPDGLNVGANIGRTAGAGVPGHFHVHAMPRWNGDTNFMTTVADTRVLPESLPATWEKLTKAWPR